MLHPAPLVSEIYELRADYTLVNRDIDDYQELLGTRSATEYRVPDRKHPFFLKTEIISFADNGMTELTVFNHDTLTSIGIIALSGKVELAFQQNGSLDCGILDKQNATYVQAGQPFFMHRKGNGKDGSVRIFANGNFDQPNFLPVFSPSSLKPGQSIKSPIKIPEGLDNGGEMISPELINHFNLARRMRFS